MMYRTGSFTCNRLLSVLVLCICFVALFCASNTEGKPFRCFRPFSSLSSFSPKAMKSKENCDFSYMRVRNASVDVSCEAEPKETEGDRKGVACFASVRLTGDVLEKVPAKDATYTVEFHAINSGSINYKGFDGEGYNVCCTMLDGSECAWEGEGREQLLVPHSCVIDKATSNGTEKEEEEEGEKKGDSWSGVIRKPLHRLWHGHWEVKVTFSRRGEVVGRLVIPYFVDRSLWESAEGGIMDSEANEGESAAAVLVSVDGHNSSKTV